MSKVNKTDESILEANREYYRRNREKITRQHKEKYQENLEESRDKASTRYHSSNKVKVKEWGKEYYKKNRESIIQKTTDYYKENKEEAKERANKWAKKNPEKKKATFKKYSQTSNGIIKRRARSAKRHATKLKATPPWLTSEHLAQIEQVYKEARRLETVDGIKRHVDHIIPLQGETVRGLHVPWNLQILTAKENMSKNNRIRNHTGDSSGL